jgi:hypothetical protein
MVLFAGQQVYACTCGDETYNGTAAWLMYSGLYKNEGSVHDAPYM